MNTVTQTETALRTRALESLLIEKGLLTTEIIDEIVEKYEKDVGPLNGAKVVARAWTDPDYKRRLLKDGTAAIAELGFDSAQGAKIVVLENTSSVHHLVVCTFAPVIPGPCSACPRTGTNPTPIALESCESRERSCENLTWIYPTP